MGWTGDAHAFAPTANYLYDTAGFWRGWHKDIWSEQQAASMIPPVTVPVVPASNFTQPAAVWGDVVVANPYNYYQAFGDLVMLAEQYKSAQAWIDTGIPRNDVGLWKAGRQFGDWLDPKSPPDDPGAATTAVLLVADSYLIRMTELLANISQDLGRDDLAEKYRGQHDDLLTEFHNTWVSEDGSLANETQTAYALAVNFGLLPEEQEASEAGAKLRQIVADNDYLVGTGFAGTPALGTALTKIGGADDFYSMLLQTEVPSWLYQVAMNGTTTWERWNSLEPNGSVNAGEMTSFSKYSLERFLTLLGTLAYISTQITMRLVRSAIGSTQTLVASHQQSQAGSVSISHPFPAATSPLRTQSISADTAKSAFAGTLSLTKTPFLHTGMAST